MVRRLLFIMISALLSGVAIAQDCYRFSYLYLHKREVGGKFFSNEMRLDFDGRTSFFYNEYSYLKDSLNVIAFDKNGNTIDEDAYAQLTRLPGAATNEKTIIDFENGTFTQRYNSAAIFKGTMPMVLPQWELTGEEEESSGYSCKIAKADYLGRKWTVWFTEEIPANVGPWFLWGLPGLIVFAQDSENLVNYRLLGVQKTEPGRQQRDSGYIDGITSKRGTAKVYDMDMKSMELLYTRYMVDTRFFNSIHGIVDGYVEDRNGNRIQDPQSRPYIPLIPDYFWK